MEIYFRGYISLLFIALALLSVLIVTRLYGFETSENFRLLSIILVSGKV